MKNSASDYVSTRLALLEGLDILSRRDIRDFSCADKSRDKTIDKVIDNAIDEDRRLDSVLGPGDVLFRVVPCAWTLARVCVLVAR